MEEKKFSIAQTEWFRGMVELAKRELISVDDVEKVMPADFLNTGRPDWKEMCDLAFAGHGEPKNSPKFAAGRVAECILYIFAKDIGDEDASRIRSFNGILDLDTRIERNLFVDVFHLKRAGKISA